MTGEEGRGTSADGLTGEARQRRPWDEEGPELVTVGRISVDLYGEQLGAGWDEVSTFSKAVGGSPTNVAVAAARLGRRVAVLTKVGDDPLGGYVRRRLEALGVDTRWVGVDAELPTPLALAVTAPPDDPELLFYRWPSAPDPQLSPADPDDAVVTGVRALWVTATGLSAEPSRGAHLTWLAARGRRAHTILDLDYRPTFWPDEAAAHEQIAAALPHVTVAVGNRTECRVALGSDDADEAADRLLELGVRIAVVKQGAGGVLVATPAERATVPPLPVDVVCGLGAGDGFGGALAHGLLAGWEPDRAVAYANAAGAIVASRLLCSDAMPTVAEIDGLLEGRNVRT
ncbi:MAG: 5-dehydro-2-deoxygluconokinase [Egibacteraceae bacterium]